MTTQRIVLTDIDSGEALESGQVDASSGLKLTGSSQWSVSKRTLRGGPSDGVDVVDLNNGELSISILPTRGMGLWRGTYHGIPIGWQSPVARPVHPSLVNLEARNGLGWLGGFNELMCRCGLSFNGPPGVDRVIDEDGNATETQLTLHGKIANVPAHHVSVEISDEGPGTLSVTGVVDETMMFAPALRLTSTVSTEAGSNGITITDVVTNRGGQPTELQLLYHTNIGRPFLGEGSKFVAPIAEVAPRDARSAEGIELFDVYAGPVAGLPEEAFFFELLSDWKEQTQVLLRNADGDRGLTLIFSTKQLPCFTLWKNTQAEADGYVTGLEPGTSFPNFKMFERERGRVILLQPGESYETSFELRVHDTPAGIAQAQKQILALQTSSLRKHESPFDKFSPT
ncbi:MAG: aldose 1-epimerase family protein [Planctomycetota bacterium]|nr:aldose 1-epimerase family protein [Planctomycetota bacterium]MDA1162833.1 aldose 1-epimerase family protein [Planctomycetota bacterium]